MTKKATLKRKLLIGKREIIITVVAIILTTAGIKASDTLFSPEADEAKDRGYQRNIFFFKINIFIPFKINK